MAQVPRPLRPELSAAHRLGARLREFRELRGLSQRELGKQVFISADPIRKVENATRVASQSLITRCDEVLRADGELISLCSIALHGQQPASGHAAPPTSEGWVSESDVVAVGAARRRYELMYRQVGGVAVGPRINAYLRQHVDPLVNQRQDLVTATALRRATSGLRAIAGICAYDAEQHAEAFRQFEAALRLAQLSGDPVFTAYVRALLTNQALSLREPARALAYTDAAFNDDQPSPALRADLHVMRARAHAMVGDVVLCMREIVLAQATQEEVDPRGEPDETSYVHAGLVELKSAEALLDVGDPRLAHQLATKSLRRGSSNPRGNVHGNLTVAMIACAGGDHDEGLDWASRAVEAAEGMESWRLRHRLQQLVGELEPLRGSQEHTQFMDRAHDLLTAPW